MKFLRYLLPLFFSIITLAYSQEEALSFSLERQDIKTIVILNSIKKFPCKNYLFDSRDYQKEDTMIIVVRDFIKPTPCSGPRAVAEEKFTVPTTEKRFYLKFWYQGKYDKWRIFRLDTAYLVKPEGVSFSTYTELKK